MGTAKEGPDRGLGITKSTVKVGSWSTANPPSRTSDNRTLFCQNPQELTFEEPVKRYSWRDSLTISLVSLKVQYLHGYDSFCKRLVFPWEDASWLASPQRNAGDAVLQKFGVMMVLEVTQLDDFRSASGNVFFAHASRCGNCLRGT